MRPLLKFLGWILSATLLCAAIPLPLNAQGGFTTITGTITDPNGLPYDCGTISAVLVVPGGTSPTLNGVGFSGSMSPVGLGCSTTPGTGPSGSFSFRVGDNGVILPSGTQWRFTVNIAPGVVPPAGFGPRSFTLVTAINCATNTPAACASNTINLSATLSASALALSRITSGGTPGGANTNVQFNDGGAFGGDPRLTFDKSGNGSFAASAEAGFMGRATTNANIQLFAGTAGLNFVVARGEALTNDVEIGAGADANSKILFSSNAGTGFTTQIPAGVGFSFATTNPGVVFSLGGPAATGLANNSSPPWGLGGSTWNGFTSQPDGYTLTSIPDAGTNPISRLQIVHGGNGFYCGPGICPGGTILDIGKATEGGSIRLNGDTSGSASLGVAAVAVAPNQINLPTATGSNGQCLKTNGANPQQTSWGACSGSGSIQFVIDGAGAVPSTGAYGQISIAASSTITGWVITADQAGSAVIDVLRSTFAGFPTTASIAGSDKPTLTGAQKNSDFTLTGWGSTALNGGTPGDELQINLNSVATVTRINLTIYITTP